MLTCIIYYPSAFNRAGNRFMLQLREHYFDGRAYSLSFSLFYEYDRFVVLQFRAGIFLQFTLLVASTSLLFRV